MIQVTVSVMWNRPCGGSHYRLGLQCPPELRGAAPGQFVMVRVPDAGQPLLRRPFSILAVTPDTGDGAAVELLYRVVGPVTRRMATLGKGHAVDIIGPLGRGFYLGREIELVAIVGGGVGIPPLAFLAASLIHSRRHPVSDIRAYIGGRRAEDLLCVDDFQKLGIVPVLTTDDGSSGDQCLVTHPLETQMADFRPDLICACGPMPMLSCVAGIAERHGVPCQVSIETMMACGLGACLGCAVPGTAPDGNYLHACSHGPVFDAGDLAW